MLAIKNRAVLTIAHVIDQPILQSFNVEGEVAADSFEDRLFTLSLIRKAKKQMEAITGKTTEEGIKTKGVLRLGNAFHGIREIVNEQKPDLVVMGTEGHTRLEGMLIGSNAEKVVRHAACPVLTVNSRASTRAFKTIVYPTSLAWDQVTIVPILREIQDLFEANLHVVWINTPSNFMSESDAKAELNKIIKKFGFKRANVAVFSDYSETKGILNFAESMNADLIVMTTHGRTGLANILAGSIAEGTLQKASCPVLTVTTKK